MQSFPKNANLDNFFPKMLISTIFPKNANLDNFFPKKFNFWQFSTSESENRGNFFHNFFLLSGEKIDFSGRIFTYGTKKCVQLIMSSNVNRLLKTNVPMEVLRPIVRLLMGRLVQQFMMKFVRMLYSRNVMIFMNRSAPKFKRKCAR